MPQFNALLTTNSIMSKIEMRNMTNVAKKIR